MLAIFLFLASSIYVTLFNNTFDRIEKENVICLFSLHFIYPKQVLVFKDSGLDAIVKPHLSVMNQASVVPPAHQRRAPSPEY